ncbi:conjugative transposon protein TraM [Pedobacter sp. GSP4]|uniref:conjugative transposon protein TraM n=1 Tax=Pedobacter sp. GSP4 TaxID=3453716 RepID=UPI003EEC19CB
MTKKEDENLVVEVQDGKSKQKISRPRLLLVLIPAILGLLTALGYYLYTQYSAVKATPGKSGINTALPEAKLEKAEPVDKMGYYEKARQDSAHSGASGLNAAAEKLGFSEAENAQEKQINEKLAAINQVIAAPYVAPKTAAPVSFGYSNAAPISKDVDRLETLMKGMHGEGDADPEMDQLNEMMDKLIAVQNPQLAAQLYKNNGLDAAPDSLFRAIPAVVAGNQKARQGSVVELRLLDTAVVNGITFPAGHAVFGLAAFSNQRLNLEIKNIRLGNQVIPVNLTVYDKRDAMIGINAPEALLTDAVNGGIIDAASSVGITGFDLTTQIAGAGIDAAKNLLTKKIGRVKQNLKEGYPLLLRDNTKKLK